MEYVKNVVVKYIETPQAWPTDPNPKSQGTTPKRNSMIAARCLSSLAALSQVHQLQAMQVLESVLEFSPDDVRRAREGIKAAQAAAKR